MTRNEAIKECKKLWKEIEKSGKTKYGFLNSPDGREWEAKNYQAHCPLCEYATDIKGCTDCPLVMQYGKQCAELGFNDSGYSSPSWFGAVKGLRVRGGVKK